MMAIMDKLLEKGELPASILAAAFGNLAQATARQQRPNMAKLLAALAQSFRIQAMNDAAPGLAERGVDKWLGALQAETRAQLGREYDDAIAQAQALGERGALRALVWGRKVSVVQVSLLARFLKQGGALVEGTKIHVCEACGFVMIRGDVPDVCPICKAPSHRFATL